MKILAGFVIAFLVSSQARASDWWTVAEIGEAPSRTMIILDYESLQVVGTTRTVWLTTVQENTDPEEIRSKNEFECTDRRNRVTSFAAYSHDQLTKTEEFPYAQWGTPVPGSVIEGVEEWICGGPPHPSFHNMPTDNPVALVRDFFASDNGR